MEPTKAPLKVNYTIEVEVGSTNEQELWVHFDTQPWMCINFGAIPYEVRKHLKEKDLLILTLDLEPRNANPKGSSEQ